MRNIGCNQAVFLQNNRIRLAGNFAGDIRMAAGCEAGNPHLRTKACYQQGIPCSTAVDFPFAGT
jgi:hypothetical protein